MSNLALQEVSCPHCQNAIDVRQHGQHIQCDACQSRFILQGHLCPNCSRYHKGEVPFCANCGQSLTRTCRRCHTNNWTGDEYCAQCGEAMDIFDLLSMHHQAVRDQHAAQRDSMIRTLKEKEEASSQQRLAEFREMEEQMHATARQQDTQRKKEEQRTFIMLIALIFLLVIMALFVVVVIG